MSTCLMFVFSALMEFSVVNIIARQAALAKREKDSYFGDWEREMEVEMIMPSTLLRNTLGVCLCTEDYCDLIIGWLVRSFVRSFARACDVRAFFRFSVRSFVLSFVHSFFCLFVLSFVRSFVRSYVRSFFRSFVRSFVQHFIHSILHVCTHYLSHSFIHANLYLHWLYHLGTVGHDGSTSARSPSSSLVGVCVYVRVWFCIWVWVWVRVWVYSPSLTIRHGHHRPRSLDRAHRQGRETGTDFLRLLRLLPSAPRWGLPRHPVTFPLPCALHCLQRVLLVLLSDVTGQRPRRKLVEWRPEGVGCPCRNQSRPRKKDSCNATTSNAVPTNYIDYINRLNMLENV